MTGHHREEFVLQTDKSQEKSGELRNKSSLIAIQKCHGPLPLRPCVMCQGTVFPHSASGFHYDCQIIVSPSNGLLMVSPLKHCLSLERFRVELTVLSESN